MKHAVICVNGILNSPGASDGWTDRAVTWLNLHTPAKAEKFEYAAGLITRRLRQQRRAEAISRMARFYLIRGWDVSFIGHSNGCDLVERVLDICPFDILSVHFFAPACDGERLRSTLLSGRLNWAHLYGSANDKALKLAGATQKLLGWAGLGYGTLGLRVQQFAALVPCAEAHVDDSQDHSSWFERGDAFEGTMRRIVANDVFLQGAETSTPYNPAKGAPFDEPLSLP